MKTREQILKEAYENFIHTIGVVCDNSREKSIAITNAQTAYLWAKEVLENEEN